uniref:Uncharacterized protein n=1 Tax=Anguilla anguilla TaxID=7936 RepID=A0A0E9PVI5_ANGAN
MSSLKKKINFGDREGPPKKRLCTTFFFFCIRPSLPRRQEAVFLQMR